MRGHTQDAAAKHLRERISNDDDNDCDDDGNNAADGSALVTFMPHALRARTQVAHEAPGEQRTPERRPAKLRLLEAAVAPVCERMLYIS
jgi:hypothetical protein